MERIKTSKTDPLRVASLGGLGDGRFVGLTIAPGKCGVSTEGFTWQRDLEADLDQLRNEHRIDVLVCLLEPDELEQVRIGALRAEVERRGMRFVHFPIRDRDIPLSLPETRVLVRRLLDEVTAGRRVLIHCMGGLGRTGTIAGCLLRSLGHPADAVFELLNAARGPHCPETPEQRRFVREFSIA